MKCFVRPLLFWGLVTIVLAVNVSCGKTQSPTPTSTSSTFTSPPAPDLNWPQFRGPGGQGHAEASGLPLTWSEKEHIAWRRELPGRGLSSPVIWGGQIWVTTALEKAASKEVYEERSKANKTGEPLSVMDAVSLHALCVSQESGEITRDIELFKITDPQMVHEINTYATPTSVIEDGRVYCHFGAFGTACLSTKDGAVLWRNQELEVEHVVGPGSSPILWQDKLILTMDGSDRQFICALDKNTGKVAWQTDRSGKMKGNPIFRKTFSTPIVVEMNGKPVLVSPGADWIYGYEPDTGHELWKINYDQRGYNCTPRPVVGLGMIFFGISFDKPEVYGLRYEGAPEPEMVWHNFKNGPTLSSPLLLGDYLYFVNDGGIFSCLNAKTGEHIYGERLGGTFASSPVLADGRIYVCSRQGVTSVIKPGTSFEVLAQNKLDGTMLASPAVLDGSIYIRTDKALYRIH